MSKTYIYILIMAVVIYLIRWLPLNVIRQKITNVTIRSFLFYVPYVTLSVMTFPAIIEATSSLWSGLLALVVGAVLAFFGLGLFPVAISCCAAVFIAELFI